MRVDLLNAIFAKLQAVRANIALAYEKLQERGAKMPTRRNMANLHDCILSLPTSQAKADAQSGIEPMAISFQANNATSLDLRALDTQAVTSMSSMFSGCSSLASLDVSGFNTQAVTSMIQMFYYCSSLASLDVSGFNTQAVTNMQQMFCRCSSLASLDVSNFNTQAVTSMHQMFDYCSSLETLIGSHTLADVENGLVVLNGTKVDLSFPNSPLFYSSMLAVLNGLADLTGQRARTISFHSSAWNACKNDDNTTPDTDTIAQRQAVLTQIANAKNWTLTH